MRICCRQCGSGAHHRLSLRPGFGYPNVDHGGRGTRCAGGHSVKNAEALETAEKITHLVVDKTGTLTAGKPQVTDVAAGEFDENAVLSLAAAVEVQSEHPLARAVVAEANHRGIQIPKVTEFLSITGAGLKGVLHGSNVLVGNQTFLAENGVSISKDLIGKANQLSD